MIPIQAPDPAAERALAGLADIVTPAPVSWMPQTWGWGALAIVLAAGLAVVLVRWRRRSLANRYRREALHALSGLERRVLDVRTRPDAVLEIAELIKRTALATFARPDVAPLAGRAWFTFVRASGFHTAGPASTLLEDAEYRPRATREAMSDADARALVAETRAWIKEHRVSA